MFSFTNTYLSVYILLNIHEAQAVWNSKSELKVALRLKLTSWYSSSHLCNYAIISFSDDLTQDKNTICMFSVFEFYTWQVCCASLGPPTGIAALKLRNYCTARLWWFCFCTVRTGINVVRSSLKIFRN